MARQSPDMAPGIARPRLVVPKHLGPLLGLLVLCVGIGILNPIFFNPSNLLNVLVQVSVMSVLAAGVNFTILTGGIDLSVGALLGLVGVLVAGLLKATGMVPLAIVSGLALGALLGLVNGILVTVGNIPSFVATLGMMAIARGLAFVYTQGRPISGFPDSFRALGAGEIFDVLPVPAVLALVVYAVAAFVLTQTPFGRGIYAIGSNEKAARLSGIPVAGYKTAAFVISGLMAGSGGVMFMGRINSAHPLGGQGYELDAIAAVVIGGTSLSGGEGVIWGSLVGALIMGVLRNGLNLLNVDPFWQQVVIGVVIVGAVLMDRRGKRTEDGATAK